MDPQTKPNHHDEPSQTRRKISKLESQTQLQADEIRALKAETRSYQAELRSLNETIQTQRLQTLHETSAREIGTQVRLRYLEQHRQRMGKPIGALGYSRIKSGDRAAHRGRPVVDALLCLTGQMTDADVYADLYGVGPETMEWLKDVPAIVETAGFRASLRSEGMLTAEFQTLFERMQGVAGRYASPVELKAAFGRDKTLQRLQDELQICYDGIVAANPPRGKAGFGVKQADQVNSD